MPIPQKDDFGGIANSKADPAKDFYSLDAHFSDTLELPRKVRSIRVGTGGDFTAINKDGEEVIFKNVISGETIRSEFIRIKSAGATVTDVVGYI